MQFNVYKYINEELKLDDISYSENLSDIIDDVSAELNRNKIEYRIIELELDETINEELNYNNLDDLLDEDTYLIEKFVVLFCDLNEVIDYTDEEIIDLFIDNELQPLYAIKEFDNSYL